MKYHRILLISFLISASFAARLFAESGKKALFPDIDTKKQFAREISFLIEKAWKKWQDAVLINDIDVEGAQGILSPGDIKGPVLTARSILANLDRKGKAQDNISCVRAVANAVENGMRLWQRGYTHRSIPFPRGASCTITLPPCNNVPVTVGSGQSPGDKALEESALYNYMLYRAPRQEKDALIVFHGSAKAISECFSLWKNSCSIIDIQASGGIAPQPAPMGPGPGLVRGAKGNNGKLVGAYFDGELMYKKMVEYFNDQAEK